MDAKPWGPVDPNSAHQFWSRWRFRIETGRRQPPVHEVVANASRFFRQLFRSSVGRLRVDRLGTRARAVYAVTLEIDGPPAHDPGCQADARRHFAEHFVARGFGPGARLLDLEVAVLAGDTQDGRPPQQLLVMPPLAVGV